MPLHCANYSLALWEYTSAAVFQGDVQAFCRYLSVGCKRWSVQRSSATGNSQCCFMLPAGVPCVCLMELEQSNAEQVSGKCFCAPGTRPASVEPESPSLLKLVSSHIAAQDHSRDIVGKVQGSLHLNLLICTHPQNSVQHVLTLTVLRLK